MILRILALLALSCSSAGPRGRRTPTIRRRGRAKRHFDRGEKLFALGKFDDALDEYQKAFDAKPIPDFLFNIGQCYRNLGDYEQAIFSFKKYLKLEPDAPDKDEGRAADRRARGEAGARRRRRGSSARRSRRRQPPPSEHTPIYKKWWFWTGVAVVGAARGVGDLRGDAVGRSARHRPR